MDASDDSRLLAMTVTSMITESSERISEENDSDADAPDKPLTFRLLTPSLARQMVVPLVCLISVSLPYGHR